MSDTVEKETKSTYTLKPNSFLKVKILNPMGRERFLELRQDENGHVELAFEGSLDIAKLSTEPSLDA